MAWIKEFEAKKLFDKNVKGFGGTAHVTLTKTLRGRVVTIVVPDPVLCFNQLSGADYAVLRKGVDTVKLPDRIAYMAKSDVLNAIDLMASKVLFAESVLFKVFDYFKVSEDLEVKNVVLKIKKLYGLQM